MNKKKNSKGIDGEEWACTHTRVRVATSIQNGNLPMNRVMLPATALLDTNATPLGLRQETRLGKCLGKLLGKNDVPREQARRRVCEGRRSQLPAAAHKNSTTRDDGTYRYSLASSAYFSLYSMREALLMVVARRGERTRVNK